MAMALDTLSFVDRFIFNVFGDFVESNFGYRYGFIGLCGRTQTQCDEAKECAKATFPSGEIEFLISSYVPTRHLVFRT